MSDYREYVLPESRVLVNWFPAEAPRNPRGTLGFTENPRHMHIESDWSWHGEGKSNQSREIHVVIYSYRSNIPKTSHPMDGLERCMEEIAVSRDSSLFELIIRYCETTGSAWHDEYFFFSLLARDRRQRFRNRGRPWMSPTSSNQVIPANIFISKRVPAGDAFRYEN